MTATTHAPEVRLRAIEPEDLDLLYRIENDASLWALGATNVPYSRYTLHEYIAQSSSDIYADKQVRLIVVDADDRAVGIADIVNFDASHRRAEIGLVIEAPYRRRGYALEAVRQLSHYGKSVLHLHQLYAIVSADNVAATRLFAHTAYQPTATLRHWLFDGTRYTDAVLYQSVL